MKWTIEKIQEEASKHDRRIDFFRQAGSAYNAARKKGILDQICRHMKNSNAGENSCNYKWTNEYVRNEALKYEKIGDFINGSYNIYQVALKRGILEEVCKHMPKYVNPSGENHPRFKWTFEKLRTEALKHKSRREFELGNRGAYQAAQARDILDDICQHMTKAMGTSVPEKELFNLLVSIFPSAKKIRDRKIKIGTKPFIYGFDIDIFIPELNLGIEFDGKHYHSFEYMRKCKNKRLWSDDDIHNYHEIKDEWFAAKGIKILHIKEDDWDANKQACLDRCLEFLDTSSEKAA